jgi:hypothetical protein
VSSVEETKATISANAGLYPGTMVSEPVLVKKLADAAVSESETLAWIHLSKQWATTFRRSNAAAV